MNIQFVFFIRKKKHPPGGPSEGIVLSESTFNGNKTKPSMKMFDDISLRGKLLLRAVCRSQSVPLPSVTIIITRRSPGSGSGGCVAVRPRLVLTWAGVCVCGLRSSSSWWPTRAAAAWVQLVTRTTTSELVTMLATNITAILAILASAGNLGSESRYLHRLSSMLHTYLCVSSLTR